MLQALHKALGALREPTVYTARELLYRYPNECVSPVEHVLQRNVTKDLI